MGAFFGKIKRLPPRIFIGGFIILIGIILGVNIFQSIFTSTSDEGKGFRIPRREKREQPPKQPPRRQPRRPQQQMEEAKPQPQPPQPVEQVEDQKALSFNVIRFMNAEIGYLVGDSIFKTVDGGENWTAQLPNQRYNFLDAAFLDTEHGFAAGYSGMYYTENGGKIWQKSRFHQLFRNVVHGISYPAENTIFAAGDFGSIFKSSDGGKMWEKQIGKDNRWVFESIHFVDPLQGWASGFENNKETGKRNGIIFKTIDGGKRWSEIFRVEMGGDDFFNQVYFVDDQHGWTGGMNGILYGTTDGGETWEELINSQNIIFDIFAIDSGHVWAVGAKGNLIRSTADGEKWENIIIGRDMEIFKSIWMLDAETGWLCGENGIVMKTEDGGRIWEDKSFER